MTLAEAVAALDALEAVIGAENTVPRLVFKDITNIHTCKIEYIVVNGDFAEQKSKAVILHNWDSEDGSGDAYWHKDLPDELKPAPPAITYFGAHELTFTQVQTYCNNTWRTATSQPTAVDIRGFGIQKIDNNLVVVRGHFDTVDGTPRLVEKAFKIWLVNPASAPTGANIKFEEIQL